MPGASPFGSIDRQAVLLTLQAAGSRDPDVLHERKVRLLSEVLLPKWAGIGLLLAGLGLVALGLAEAPAVVPLGTGAGAALAAAGTWLWRQAARNVAMVEAVWSEFVKAPGA
jgi:hypothetical protein